MIISRTPFRISFFGGGTDYPVWYNHHQGAVLSTTINKYCYITVRYLPPFFEHRYRIVYSKIENVKYISEIQHPAVRALLEYCHIDKGVEIHHDGDLPARSGLGSSSSFTVGLLHSLYALKEKMVFKEQLAREAIYVEREILKENVGSQDQIAVAYGGLNKIIFEKDDFRVEPLTISEERIQQLQNHLMLIFTGIQRTASKIVASQIKNTFLKEKELNIMKNMVDEAIDILNNPKRDILEFGNLLHKAWEIKKNLSEKISNITIDNIYDTALKSGAIGGKLLGAGGGGFILLFVPPQKQEKVREALNKFIKVDFRFEKEGSQIIYYTPQKELE